MRQSVDLLVEGRLLVIFPEGYPNIDPNYTTKTEPDEFLPFKPGFVSIASAAEKQTKSKNTDYSGRLSLYARKSMDRPPAVRRSGLSGQ